MSAMVAVPRRVLRPPRAIGRSGVDLVGWLCGLALVVVGVRAGSPLAIVTGPLVVVLVVVETKRRRRWRRDLVMAESLPGSVDHLIQRLRSGASLGQACRSSGREAERAEMPTSLPLPLPMPTSTDDDPLRPLVAALERGATLTDASRALGREADPSVRLLATTLRLLAANGGPAVPALRRLRHTLVGRVHRRRRAQAQAASALSSAALLVLAPTFFALILAGSEPELAFFYLHQPLGAACATASVLLSAAGWVWIHRQVARFRWADG